MAKVHRRIRALEMLNWVERRNIAKENPSYTITREHAPIYRISDVMPKSFARGKRGIAGQLLPYLIGTHK